MIGVVRMGWAMHSTMLRSPFLPITKLAATIHEPPVRFCTTSGLVMIFCSLRILAARRISTSGVPPGLVPVVISMGPVGAVCAWSAAGAAASATPSAAASTECFSCR